MSLHGFGLCGIWADSSAPRPATTDDEFFRCLSPADLINYAKTQRVAYAAVSSYVQRAFAVSRLLSRFFTPIEIGNFRYWQSYTGMFISGSTALQFFDRSFYPDSDLDLYVEHRYRVPIVAWLLSIGYAFVPRKGFEDQTVQEALAHQIPCEHGEKGVFFESKSEGYFGRGVANVYNFHKYNPDRKIQLITSHHAPLEIILNFHSTCVMNIITHDKAYSLYPRGTFEERRSLIYSTEGSRQENARKKYAERGWTMVKQLSSEELNDPSSAFARGGRHVGDSSCWTIAIPPLLGLDLPQSFIESNSWDLQYNNEREPVMNFSILVVHKLRHSYLVAGRALQAYLWPLLSDDESPQKDRTVDEDMSLLLRWRRSSHT